MISSMVQSLQSNSGGFKQATALPVSQRPEEDQGGVLRRRLSFFSLNKIQLSDYSDSATRAFRARSKSVDSVIREWWDWGWAWILSRKPAFARDLEMNEEETAILGFHSRGSLSHVFFKLRSHLSRRSLELPQTTAVAANRW